VQAAGVDVAVIENPSLARLFANALPMGGASALARSRFEHLFAPLASLYATSLAMFGLALLTSIPAALRNMKRFGPVMLLSLVVSFCFWLFLFNAGSALSSLQRLIVGGEALGYVVVFVCIPMLYLILIAALPHSTPQQDSSVGASHGNG
jgi:hypothetical protein